VALLPKGFASERHVGPQRRPGNQIFLLQQEWRARGYPPNMQRVARDRRLPLPRQEGLPPLHRQLLPESLSQASTVRWNGPPSTTPPAEATQEAVVV